MIRTFNRYKSNTLQQNVHVFSLAHIFGKKNISVGTSAVLTIGTRVLYDGRESNSRLER